MASFDVEISGLDDALGSFEAAEGSLDGNPTGSVGVGADYGAMVEYGTSSHTITPNGAEALNWTEGGEEVFATEVQHPGTPAQPFFRPAIRETATNLGDIVDGAPTLEAAITLATLSIQEGAQRRAPVDTGKLRSSIQSDTP